MGRQCLICGNKKGRLHQYHAEWKQHLVSHCNEDALARLNAPGLASGDKKAFICALHFGKHLDGTRFTAETGSESLLKEFCAPARLPKPENDPSSRSAKRAPSKTAKFLPSEAILHTENHLPTSNSTSTSESNRRKGSSSQSSGGIKKSKIRAFATALENAIQAIEPDCQDDNADLLRQYLLRCEKGREIIVGAVLSVGEDLLAHMPMLAPRRPVAKAILRSLSALDCEVSHREICFGTGLSRNIVRLASQELEEVCSPPVHQF